MSSIKTRVRALEILNKSDKSGAHSSALLQRASLEKDVNLGLLQRLVKGTLQWRSRLDDELDKAFGAKKGKVPAVLRNIMRMAAYQILFLKNVPMPLVAKESLQLARPHASLFSAKELEGILSILEKAPKQEESRAPQVSSAAAIAREYSHPQWVVERWVTELGPDETLTLCRANNKP